MQDSKIMVATEYVDISKKIHDLKKFMHSEQYSALDCVDQGLLMVQLVAMNNYEDALKRRIQILRELPCSGNEAT